MKFRYNEKQKFQEKFNTLDICIVLAHVINFFDDSPVLFAHIFSSESISLSWYNVEEWLSRDPNKTLPDVLKYIRYRRGIVTLLLKRKNDLDSDSIEPSLDHDPPLASVKYRDCLVTNDSTCYITKAYCNVCPHKDALKGSLFS